MFLAKCPRCSYLLGRVRNPQAIEWIKCRQCGQVNHMLWCVNPNERYDDTDDKIVTMRERDLTSDVFRGCNFKPGNIIQ